MAPSDTLAGDALVVLGLVRPLWHSAAMPAGALLVLIGWWLSIRPSNDRV
jgi:uncharacterized membrane protein